MTNTLKQLAAAGTSPWLDNIRRGWLRVGRVPADGRRGGRRRHVEPHDLPEGDRRLDRLRQRSRRRCRRPASTARRRLLRARDRRRARRGRPDPGTSTTRRGHLDGFVSFELPPAMANDTAASIAAAPEFFERIGRPNIFIKIPGTAEGVPAIEETIAAGINVNVTLLFSLHELRGHPPGLHPRPGAAGRGRRADRRPPLGGELLRQPGRHGGRRAAARRTRPCAARRPSRTRSSPTSASARSPAPTAGGRWRRRARTCSGRCGRRPARRTRPTRTCSTSTS